MKKSVIGNICCKVNKIINECGTRDPLKICAAFGINIYYFNFRKKLKGYYLYKFGIHNIALDENLNEVFVPIILAHELGHYALHSDQNKIMATYQDVAIHDSLDSMEVQAHFFCAELLLSDQAVISAFEEYGNFEAAAKYLMVPFDLLDFKLQIMDYKGLPTIKDLNYANRNFLKNDLEAYS